MVLISEDLSGASNEPDHVPPISGTCALDAARQVGSRDGLPAVRLAPSGRARAVSLIYLTAVRQGKTPHTTPQV